MFPCSSFMYCCHAGPFAHNKVQIWQMRSILSLYLRSCY
jgi:hypothetical protein